MAYLQGILATNKAHKILCAPAYEVCSTLNNALPKKSTYLIGLDQSTTCTGIYLTNKSKNLHILLDYARDGKDKHEYRRELRILLSTLLKGLTVELIVIEKPVPSKYRFAGDVLRELKGYVEGLKDIIPELYNAKLDSIMPQSWKSKIVDKSKGKHRFNVKYEVATDICDRIPCIRPYLGACRSADYDSFDAVGILHGYLAKCFNEKGERVAFGRVERTHKPIAFFKYLTPAELRDYDSLYKGLKFKQQENNPKVFSYNEDLSFYENIRMCSSNYPFSLIVLKDVKLYVMLAWYFNIDLVPGKVFVMFISREHAFTKSQLETVSNFNYTFKL